MEGVSTPLLDRVAAKRDRLVGYGTARAEAASHVMEREGGVHHITVRIAVLAGSSCAVFLIVLGIVCSFYHRTPMGTLFICLLLIAAGTFLSVFWVKQRWHRWLGRFLAIAAVLGTLVGLYVYYRHLIYYYQYQGLKTYTDVAPTQNPALFTNVGVLEFTINTKVDVSQYVGYQSVEMGAVLCVAPIIDTTATAVDKISLYAAGVDCCAWRSQFNCGDIRDATVAGGLMYLSPEQLVNPLMEWAIQDPQLVDGFRKAVKLQTAIFETPVAEHPRFVFWSADPQKAVLDFQHRGDVAAVLFCLAFLVLSLVASTLAALGQRHLLIMMGTEEPTYIAALLARELKV